MGLLAAAPAEPKDELAALEEEITKVVAPAEAAPAAAPPAKATAAAAKKAGLLGRLGGLLGTAGLALLLVGALGALVALNYDTWVRGQSTNSVGSTQSLGIVVMAVVTVAGVAMLLMGTGKLKRKPARSA